MLGNETVTQLCILLLAVISFCWSSVRCASPPHTQLSGHYTSLDAMFTAFSAGKKRKSYTLVTKLTMASAPQQSTGRCEQKTHMWTCTNIRHKALQHGITKRLHACYSDAIPEVGKCSFLTDFIYETHSGSQILPTVPHDPSWSN